MPGNLKSSAMRFRYLLALLILSRPALAEVLWLPHTPGTLHESAVVVDRVGGSVKVLCRARLADGYLHPGTTTDVLCVVPQKGRVERVREFEVAVRGAPRWTRDDWAGSTAVGRQGRTDLFFCRAPVRVGDASTGWAFGKAYREGSHARHCYVAFGDREIDVGGEFEILRIEPR